LDLDRYRGEIQSLVAAQTGCSVHLGKLRAQFLPRLGFVVRDVAIGNPPGFAGGNLASAEEVRVTVAFWPLFRRRIELHSVELVRPNISLLEDSQGKFNYVFATASNPAYQPSTVSEAGFAAPILDAVTPRPPFSLAGVSSIWLTDANIRVGQVRGNGAVSLQLELKHLNGNLESISIFPGAQQNWEAHADLKGLQAVLPGWVQPLTFLSGFMTLQAGRAEMEFSSSLGDVGDLKGNVLVNDVTSPIVQFNLQSDQLSLDAISAPMLSVLRNPSASKPRGDDRYAPVSDTPSQSTAPPAQSLLVARGQLAAKRVVWQTYTAGPLTAELRLFNDRAEIWPFTLGLYGGVVEATSRIDRTASPARFSANIQGRTLDLGRMLGDSPALKGKLFGLGDFDLQVFGSLDPAWRKFLAGTGKFSVRNGHLPTVNLAGAAGPALEENSSGNATPFRLISGDVAIADQRIASRKIHIESTSGIVDLSGSLGFNGAVKYEGQISFPQGNASPQPTGGIPAFLNEILRGAAGKLVVPFTLKGTLAQPQVLPASSAPSGHGPT